MNIDSIIFDLDGTLWDSTDIVLKAWAGVLADKKEIQKPLTKEDLQGIMGFQVPEASAKLFPYLEEETRIKLMKECCTIECEWIRREGGVLYENLEDTLKTLSKKYPLFIVSNCQGGYIDAFLEYHDLKKYFKDFECAGNTGLVKGKNIKAVIERNKLEHAIYVGDTQSDCNAAKLAEVPFVFASYGFGKVDRFDYSIKSVGELAKLF